MPSILMTKRSQLRSNRLNSATGTRSMRFTTVKPELGGLPINKPSFKRQAFNLVKHILASGTMNNFLNYYRNSNRHYMLLNNNGETLLGFALMYPQKSGKSRLALIGTLPGKGYGKTLMDRIYANAKKEHMKKVRVLNAVPGAQKFYLGRGYKRVPSPSTNTYDRVYNKSVTGRAPTAITISSRQLGSVSARPKRKRTPTPRATSGTPTSKRRKTPTPNN
jgi:N-acetylglutamate synthase-like GNAT family acetyltransferase